MSKTLISTPLLEIQNLTISFALSQTPLVAVRKVSFKLERGQTLGLAGESGSGKSLTALSIPQLLPPEAEVAGESQILFKGQNLCGLKTDELRALRGQAITMIFQEPMSSLNPLHQIGYQIYEILALHQPAPRNVLRARVIELLEEVGVAEPEKRRFFYPHQLSGGQRQRVMIAMALANNPDLLIADEPTTALDVTLQTQILTLLKKLQSKHGMAILFITHDLGLLKRFADHVAIMYQGELVETGEVQEVFTSPKHEYTQRLLASEPKGGPLAQNPAAPMLLEVEHLRVWFPIRKGFWRRTHDYTRAVDDISLSVREGQTLGIVGESGSGKTTLGLAILRLISSTGSIVYKGVSLDRLSSKELRPKRRAMQIVFQDPFGSLSPRMSVLEIVSEGLYDQKLSFVEKREKVAQALSETGIDPGSMDRYPHEFSGGQRQRIAIARALILEPDFIVLDEPTSALDRSVQVQIVDLLRRLQKEHDLTYLFISHDLKLVRALASDVIVMKAGKIVEVGSREKIFSAPEHPYTQALLAAAFGETLFSAPLQPEIQPANVL